MKRKVAAWSFAIFVAAFFVFNLSRSYVCRPQPWMREQIQDDLSAFSAQSLKPMQLRKHYESANPTELLVYYQIKDNKVYWKKNWIDNTAIDRVRKTTRMLDRMTRTRKLPDMEFILTVHDSFDPDEEMDRSVPTFCYAKEQGIPGVLFPDPLSEGFARHSRKNIARSKMRPKYSWRNKVDIAFWRGGTTGGAYQADNWYLYPRAKLSLLTKYYPDLIDTGFTTYPGVAPAVQKDMEANLPKVSWTVHKDHLKYKYLVVPDGNTCTYPRFYLGLYSNSVVFKQDSDQIQWFYRALIPYEHFVPVHNDFSNLPEVVSWAKRNDLKMQMISKNATNFINHNLLPKHIYKYVETLLNTYAALQNESHELYEGVLPFSHFKEKK